MESISLEEAGKNTDNDVFSTNVREEIRILSLKIQN